MTTQHERLRSSRPYELMHAERARAHALHGEKPGGSMEDHAPDDGDWLPVLTEELGEVARALCDHRHGLLTVEERDDQLRHELVQLGAMAAAWLSALGVADPPAHRAPDAARGLYGDLGGRA